MSLIIRPLRSGSSGNSLLATGGSTSILIDAGFTEREMIDTFAEVGITTESLHAVVITHAHSDHLGIAVRLSRLGKLPVYATEETARSAPPLRRLKRLHILDPGAATVIGDLRVEAVPLSHDAPGTVACVVEHGGARFGVATDLGRSSEALEAALATCDGMLLEFNHDERALREGPYPWRLRRRVLGEEGHLSNEQAGAVLARCAGERLRAVYLGHLSEKNNNPQAAVDAARRALQHAGRERVEIIVAPRGVPGPEMRIGA